MLSNFKVSELSLLKFTAFIMTCPTSVHQLKRSEPHPVVWPKVTELIISPRLPSCNLFPLIYTEVVCVLFCFVFCLPWASKDVVSSSALSPWAEPSWFTVLTLGSGCFFSSLPTPVPFPFLCVVHYSSNSSHSISISVRSWSPALYMVEGRCDTHKCVGLCSVQFSRSVVSDSSRPHGL